MRTLVVLSVLLIHVSAFAQDYAPRGEYGQNLEPKGRILHGAGQDPGAFRLYDDAMDQGEEPMTFMYYRNLSNIGTNWASTLRDTLRPYLDRMIVIQFGLELVGLTEEVAAGNMDQEISDWLDGIEDLGLPVYARLGYEFNGLSWNGYLPGPYKAAFIYLTEKIRERDLEIATVWNFSPVESQPRDFMAYYPGDEYVDWWSINVFNRPEIGSTLSTAYLDSADAHGRPVQIGESTPKDIGVHGGQASWNAWFAPFFDMIAAEPGIKMTGYINWDWSKYPQWADWGDARIEQNEIVRQNFADEMDESLYFHAGTERAYRVALGATEEIPPPRVENLIGADDPYPGLITWDAATDDSGISRYLVYESDQLVSYTGKTEFRLNNFPAGQALSLSVSAVDRAGNEGPRSASVAVTAPTKQLVNGEFDEGTTGWALTIFDSGASGTFDIDPSGQLSGPNSAHVTLLTNTGTNWHIQLEQPLTVEEGHRYAISYQAKSNVETTMETWLQQSADPYAGYAMQTVSLSPEAATYYDTAFVSIDDDVLIRFMLGVSGLAEIWVDNVSLIDLDAVPTGASNEMPAYSKLKLANPYPNPFTGSVNIEFETTQSGPVRIEIYNMLGQIVATIADGHRSAGSHIVRWSDDAARSGVYLVRIFHGGQTTTRTIVLRK